MLKYEVFANKTKGWIAVDLSRDQLLRFVKEKGIKRDQIVSITEDNGTMSLTTLWYWEDDDDGPQANS